MSAVDEFDLAEASPDGGASPVRSARRGHTHPWGWALAAVAMIAVGSANAAAIPATIGSGDGIEVRLLDVDVASQPTLVWEAPLSNGLVAAIRGGIAVTFANGVSNDVVGIDLETGAETWTYRGPGTSCQWNDSGTCVEDPGTPEAAIIEIDLETGAEGRHAHPGALAAARAGDGMAVVEATDSETEDVVLVEPDGTERWRVAADAAEFHDADSGGVVVYLSVTNTSVSVDLEGTSIDLESGAATPTVNWPVLDGMEIRFEDDGTAVATLPDGEFRLLAGESWYAYDDDFAGAIVLMQGDGSPSMLVARWRADGAELWRGDDPDCYFAARLSGTAVAQCWSVDAEGLQGLNQLTGEVRWERPNTSVLTAGSDALLVADRNERAVLALSPADGSVLWSLPVPVDYSGGVTALPDGILLSTPTSLVRLRWE